jgi:hypothetical protein
MYGGSDGERELQWWVRWEVRTAVVGQMAIENCCDGSDGG